MQNKSYLRKSLVCILLSCCLCMGSWNMTEADALAYTSASMYTEDRYCYKNHLYCAVDNKIYQTNLDGSEPELIYEASYKKYGKITSIGDLWVLDGYIYFVLYVNNSGDKDKLMRMTVKGRHLKELVSAPGVGLSMAIYHNKIIYSSSTDRINEPYKTYQMDLDGKNKTKLFDEELYSVEYMAEDYMYVRLVGSISRTVHDIWELRISGSTATVKKVAEEKLTYATDEYSGDKYLKSQILPYVWNGEIYYLKVSGGNNWQSNYWLYRCKKDQTKDILAKWKNIYGTWRRYEVGGGGGNFWVKGNYFYCTLVNNNGTTGKMYFCRFNLKTKEKEKICKWEDSELVDPSTDMLLIYEKDGKLILTADPVNGSPNILTIDVKTGECVKNL